MPVETVGTEIRVRVRQPGEFIDGSFRQLWPNDRTVPGYPYNEQGIRAIGGKLKGSDDWKEQSIRFSTDEKYGWTEAKAEAWVRDHDMTPKSLDSQPFQVDFSITAVKALAEIPEAERVQATEGQDVIYIEGPASTDEPDRQGEVVEQASLQTADFEKNPILLFGHNPDWPIGKVIAMEKNAKLPDGKRGLMVRAAIIGATDKAREVIQLVKDKIVRGFSIRGQARKRGNKLVALNLMELSVVPVPANQGTLFTVAKSLLDSPGDPEPEVLAAETREKEEPDMAETEKQEGQLPPELLQKLEALDALDKRVAAVEAAIAEMQKDAKTAEPTKPADAPKAQEPAEQPAGQVVETKTGVKKSVVRDHGKPAAADDKKDVVKGLDPKKAKQLAEQLWMKTHPQ